MLIESEFTWRENTLRPQKGVVFSQRKEKYEPADRDLEPGNIKAAKTG